MRGICLLLAGVACASLAQMAAAVDTDASAALTATYVASAERLHDSPFHRPIFLDSTESSSELKGEVYALLEQPLAMVSTALSSPAHWCDVLLLHPNVAQCRVSNGVKGVTLALNLGKKLDPSLEASYATDFSFQLKQANPNYLEIRLDAKEGPMGTSDYRILLEAVPVPGGKTFLHLAYSYSYGFSARLATQIYLATRGNGKIGFTVVGTGHDGKPKYISGLRGTVERNAMRYYLAIDAYLNAVAAPGQERFEHSLQHWFDSVEEYPRQLKDDERVDYLAAKRSEHQRQQASQ
jgi:hypothetical protein